MACYLSSAANARGLACASRPQRQTNVSRLQTPLRVAARRRSPSFFEDTSDVSNVVEEATASSGGLFNDSFKSVLASALERSGTSTLLQGQEKHRDENHISDQEEVLKAAIMASKSTLLKLNMIKSEVEKAIEVESKQVERLMFALDKARNDAAYYKGLSIMLEDGGTSDS